MNCSGCCHTHAKKIVIYAKFSSYLHPANYKSLYIQGKHTPLRFALAPPLVVGHTRLPSTADGSSGAGYSSHLQLVPARGMVDGLWEEVI